ncbi:hypothetical protein [Vibrio furnissii]|uniref:hypothetical protein n=1 Tax=Vibrio furnissii TaxID=29494 RepID=UPI001EEB0619|nr:hypothetical protein [Vibrio furnissii]MCG6233114.1 hypothetical protein [Vibrio furnissii]MCG6258932.1 hypothetical protein [Vibrio furnissii]
MSELLTDVLIPSDCEFQLGRTERENKSKFTSASQIIGSPTALWEVSLTFSNVRTVQAKVLIATLLSMRGAAGRFQLFDWSAPAADGLGGTYYITNLSQAAPGLLMILTPNPSTKIASAGDYVGVDGELKALVADVVTDSLGYATVMFEPFMRNPVTADTQVTFDRPTGEFRLKPGYKVPRPTSKKLVIAEITVEAIEAVTI